MLIVRLLLIPKKKNSEYKNPIFILVDDRIDKLGKIEKQLNACLQRGKDVVSLP